MEVQLTEKEYMPKRYDNETVLVFSDTHFPYEHKYAIEFIADMVSCWKPDRIIHGGDLMDIYSVSAYPKDPNHPDSWDKEIKKARKKIAKLAEIVPKLDIVESNHDDRAYKKSRLSGIPREFLVPYKEVVGAPEDWKWHRELSITVDSTRDRLFFAHTKTGGSTICAKDKGCTSIIGHHHSRFGATAFKPSKNKLIWGVDAGCLVSDEGAPYAYNKQDRGRPVQGCVIIQSGVPTCIPLS